jgi:hypothetical protein
MENLEKLGKLLSKEEMCRITGGETCRTSYDCPDACINDPNLIEGTYCNNGVCTFYPYACP